MIKPLISLATVLALAAPLNAQDEQQEHPSPNQIVAEASAGDWMSIPAEDLLVMTLAPDAEGNERKVVIQLMPAPFSQGWVENIRTLARARWYDDISVNRVQDNYVVQWGDPNYDNPEAAGEAKPLPEGLRVMGERCYIVDFSEEDCDIPSASLTEEAAALAVLAAASAAVDSGSNHPTVDIQNTRTESAEEGWHERDPYAPWVEFFEGWPLGAEEVDSDDAPWQFWPIHCYGMIGVGRNYSPDTGSGAELYTVIGHAPRHLDRNIALVGRVIEGMEHLSSLPRGKGDLGFYAADEVDKRTPILTVRVASDLPAGEQPKFEYLDTESETFARYADARANRRDPFFIVPAGGADICNIPVPVRRVAQ